MMARMECSTGLTSVRQCPLLPSLLPSVDLSHTDHFLILILLHLVVWWFEALGCFPQMKKEFVEAHSFSSHCLLGPLHRQCCRIRQRLTGICGPQLPLSLLRIAGFVYGVTTQAISAMRSLTCAACEGSRHSPVMRGLVALTLVTSPSTTSPSATSPSTTSPLATYMFYTNSYEKCPLVYVYSHQFFLLTTI